MSKNNKGAKSHVSTRKTTGRRVLQNSLKLKENTNFSRLRSLIVVFVITVAGIVLLLTTRASVSTSSLQPEVGGLSGGASKVTNSSTSGNGYLRFGSQPANTTFRRFFADSASWNQPVSVYGKSTALDTYADRFWNYAGLPATPGTTNVDFKDYSVPMYEMPTANKNVKLFQVVWAQGQQSFSTTGLNIGTTIPWNDNWKPGTGNDRIMHVVDFASGENYGFWVVGEPKEACLDLFGPNTQAGYDVNNPNHLCMAAANRTSGMYTITDGTTHTERGMGIDKLALVTRAEEVKSGAIRHALEMSITSTMFGMPECSPNKGNSAAGSGTSCGFYLPPATRVEFTDNQNNILTNRCPGNPITIDNATRSKTVPEGLRIAINISDTEIDTWLNQRGYTGAKRETARIFAIAFRDYGAVVAETGCYGIGIETDGLINPTSAALWSQLGISDIEGNNNPHGDLLQGLLTRQRIYVVNPPSN